VRFSRASQGYTLATITPSLGATGIEAALHESDAAVLFADSRSLRKLSTLPPKVTLVVLLPPRGSNCEEAVTEDLARVLASLPPRPSTLTLLELKNEGRRVTSGAACRPPAADDIAVIMFTSGTTGAPKGVQLTHASLIAAVGGMVAWCDANAPWLGRDDVMAAYLPSSHILEFVAEQTFLAMGGRLAFSHHSTLAARAGRRGDLQAAGVTVLPAVPAILAHIAAAARRAIWPGALDALVALNELALSGGGGGGALRHAAARAASMLTPALGALAFGAARRRCGRLRLVLCGGAPLSASLAATMRALLGCPLVLGYGLTESACAGTLGRLADSALGQSGPPIACARIKLVAWDEGGYSPAHVPPAGEICIGGPALAVGYHNRRDGDDFFVEGGARWLRTGDIGTVETGADGTSLLRIIDRKKDLVKLQKGEYVALSALEAAMSEHSAMTAHVMAVVPPGAHSPTALVAPNEDRLRAAVRAAAGAEAAEAPLDSLLLSDTARGAVLGELRAAPLHASQLPVAVRLVAGPWTPENGLVTSALKTRRNEVARRFAMEIEELNAAATNRQ
jgi:long-chain acyl-CoA synthetase